MKKIHEILQPSFLHKFRIQPVGILNFYTVLFQELDSLIITVRARKKNCIKINLYKYFPDKNQTLVE